MKFRSGGFSKFRGERKDRGIEGEGDWALV